MLPRSGFVDCLGGPLLHSIGQETQGHSPVIELTIKSIRVSRRNYQRVVILREKEADRYLPIWIGPAEADAIAVRLQEVAVARPLTHDLLTSMIENLGGVVRAVVV